MPGCMQQEIVRIKYECSIHSIASRDVLPDCFAGWRRSSQNGVGTGTCGHSTSSLQSPGIIHQFYPFFANDTHIYIPNFVINLLLRCDADVYRI